MDLRTEKNTVDDERKRHRIKCCLFWLSAPYKDYMKKAVTLVLPLFVLFVAASQISHHKLVRVRSQPSAEDRAWFDSQNFSSSIGLLGGIANAPGYALPLRIGSSNLLYLVSLDTGSADMAIAGTGCLAGSKACITSDAPYDASKSNSSAYVPCNNTNWTCQACMIEPRMNASVCHLTSAYEDGSFLMGNLFSDIVSLVSSENATTATNSTPSASPVLMSGRADFAAIANASVHFFGNGNGKTDGIVGLAYRNLSASGAVPLFDALVAQSQTTDLFSLCLNDNGGLMVIGGVNESLAIEPIQYTPLTAPRGYYELSPLSLTLPDLGNFSIDLSETVTVLDSGTTLLLLPKIVYENLTAAFPLWCRSHPDSYLLCNPTETLLKLKSPACLNFHETDFENMPNMTFSFPLADGSGASFHLNLTARQYIRYSTASDRSWDYCGELGVAANSAQPNQLVLGDVFFKGFYTVFDRETNRVGFGRQNETMCGGYAPAIISKTNWLYVGFACGGVGVILLVLVIIWAVSKARNRMGYQPIN